MAYLCSLLPTLATPLAEPPAAACGQWDALSLAGACCSGGEAGELAGGGGQVWHGQVEVFCTEVQSQAEALLAARRAAVCEVRHSSSSTQAKPAPAKRTRRA